MAFRTSQFYRTGSKDILWRSCVSDWKTYMFLAKIMEDDRKGAAELPNNA